MTLMAFLRTYAPVQLTNFLKIFTRHCVIANSRSRRDPNFYDLSSFSLLKSESFSTHVKIHFLQLFSYSGQLFFFVRYWGSLGRNCHPGIPSEIHITRLFRFHPAVTRSPTTMFIFRSFITNKCIISSP